MLSLKEEVHSIWVIWTSGLQECKGNFMFRSRAERAGSMGFIQAVKEACPGRGPTLGRCDLARGQGRQRTHKYLDTIHVIIRNTWK